MKNIQPRTAPILCKNVPLAVLFGSNGNSYAVSMQADMCFYIYIYIYIHTHTHTHTYSSQYRDAVRVREIKSWDSSECRVPRERLCVPFWTHMP